MPDEKDMSPEIPPIFTTDQGKSLAEEIREEAEKERLKRRITGNRPSATAGRVASSKTTLGGGGGEGSKEEPGMEKWQKEMFEQAETSFGKESEKPSGKENPKTENELAKRMLNLGIDLHTIKDLRLQAFIRRVGSQRTSRLTYESLLEEYEFLNNQQREAQHNPSKKENLYSEKELNSVLIPLSIWLEELDTAPTEKIQTKTSTKDKEGVQTVRIEKNIPKPEEETPEGWIKFIFSKIDEVEKATEGLRSPQEVDLLWSEIEKSINIISNRTGDNFTPSDMSEDNQLARQYFRAEYPKGFFLKDRLQAYLNARKNLHIRYLQIVGAGGNLAAMGLGSEELKHLNIGVGFQELSPEDEWTIIHSDEMFAKDLEKVSNSEKKELLPDLDSALSKWYVVGSKYNELPDDLLTDEEKRAKNTIENFMGSKWPKVDKILERLKTQPDITQHELNLYRQIPTYKSTLNGTSGPADLADRISRNLERHNATILANRLLTCWLTFHMFDRDLAIKQGKHEVENLMYFDAKRGQDFGEKGKQVDPEWTVQRYFSRPHQEDSISEEKAKKDKELAHRKEKLKLARQRAVFAEKEDHHQGELIGDYLHTSTIEVVYGGKLVKKRLISFAIDRGGNPIPGGWKQMPFFRMGKSSYSDYFTSSISIVKTIGETLVAPAKLEEMTDRKFWVGKKALLGILGGMSPFLNSEWEAMQNGKTEDEIKKIKESTQDKFRATYAAGLFWFGSLDAQRGVDKTRGKSVFKTQDIDKIMNAMEAAGFVVTDKYRNQLIDDIEEMGFGAHHWRLIPGLNWARKNRKDTER